MPPEHRTTTTHWRLYTTILLLLPAAPAEGKGGGGGATTKFDFATLTLGSLKLLGDAHLRNGSIRLSRDLPVPNSGAGRALYADPIRLLHPTTRLPVPFSTSFSFTITNLNPSSIGGGLAFLLSSDDHSLGDAGAFLGLLNSTSPSPSIVAVEFDTLMDLQFDDINDNHVGIDLNSLASAQSADLDSADIDLRSGDLINAWIDYGSATIGDPLLEVFVSYSAARPADPVLSLAVDLGRYLDGEFMYVGFSGSTQGSTEIHSIQWWSFSSTSPAAPAASKPPPPPPPPMVFSTPIPPPTTTQTPIAPSNAGSAESPASSALTAHPSPSRCQTNGLCKQGPAAVAGVATGSVVFAAAFAGLLFWAKKKMSAGSVNRWDNLAAASEIVRSPREFSYRELSLATHAFNPCRIIGHGAFGTVYRGIIPATGAIIAVKRCIGGDGDAAQGRAEFLSELSIIASLRHRHLVRLQGWCHEKGEILLVYDYMIHGSLDKALFDSGTGAPPLPWRHRRHILSGVASALAYLHHECERQVIHRDVKSSNVMLDEGYHARLGDFGLARQIEHDKSPDATVTAGTMGYLAPEYLLTGRATEKTDVFSFGAVVLEVVSGRRPIDGDDAGGSSRRKKGRNLVEWVWGLHGEGRVMEAVDARMGGEFEEGEVRRAVLVGLACSSPDPTVRPGMRAVVQMLSGEADPPFVPSSKPSMSFSTTTHHLLMSLQDSVSDCNAMGLNLSSSSSSSSSLIDSLRPASGGGGF